MNRTARTPMPRPEEARGARVFGRLQALAAFSAEGPDRLTRLYLTPEHAAAARQVGQWMGEAGMAVHMDATGTMVGRYEGDRPDAPAILLGSHIDTVRNAGRYDGNLGVIVAIEAVQRLADAGRRLPFAIEVLAFGDEEGVRFPVTLTSSRAVAGIFDPATLDVTDGEGTSLGAALRAFGCDPAAIPAIARDRAKVGGYLEVHIEQGPVLEDGGLPVGIVSAISGATRMNVSVTGFAGHAGTVPMGLRKDAGAAAAEMVLAIEAVALGRPDVVATVGQMAFDPGAVNVIPSAARFTLDLRSPSDASRQAALDEVALRLSAIAARRSVKVETRHFYNEDAATCDAGLIAALSDATAAHGIAPRILPSGAGHDGLAMAALCPFAMLFVRCKGGISHNPAESITADDAGIATDILVDALTRLDPAIQTSAHRETKT